MSEHLISTADVEAASRALQEIEKLRIEAEDMATVFKVRVMRSETGEYSLMPGDIDAVRQALVAKRLGEMAVLISRMPAGVQTSGLTNGLQSLRSKLLGPQKVAA